MNEVPRHQGQERKHSAACSRRGQAEVQAEVLGCLGQALSDTLAVCLIICKAGGAGECKCDQFLSESPVLLAPTPPTASSPRPFGGQGPPAGAGGSFPSQTGGQEGSTEGSKLLAPADVDTTTTIPRKLWGAMSSAGERD